MSFEHFLWAFEIRQARLSAKNHFYKARQTATAFSLAHALHKRFFARNTAPLFFNGKFTLLLTNLLIFALKKREFSLSFWHFCEFLAKFHRKFTTFCHCEHFQNGLRPSLRARRSRSVAIQKTHFVRLLVGQTPKAPSLAEGVGGGYFVAKIPQIPRHHAPKNVSVSQNLPPNSLKIQLPQFLECVK